MKNVEFKGSNKNIIYGLSDSEVKDRILKGEVNKLPKAPSRTLWQMIRANFFNVFTIINVVLAAVVILAGSPKNAIFAFVIIINSFVGISQEMKSKKTLEKLSVLNMAHAIVVRNGKKQKISIEELVKDDIVYLDAGQQILADCETVQSDELEIDESMLTGEADPVHKLGKDKLLSGSFVVAGEGYGRVTSVGKETYSSKLAEEARKFKITNSELQEAINKIIKVLLWLIVPIGICLMITQLVFTKCSYNEAAIAAVSGIVGMIPEGLVLLTSTTFIVSVVKLAKYHTLVQQLSATEGLARVDILCLDKTGTITEGKLELTEVVPLNGNSKEEIDHVLAALVHNMPSKNPTQQAILDKYTKCPTVNVIEKVPFSSKRKWGGLNIKEYGSWLMGAPEIILGTKYDSYKDIIEKNASKGMRVLLLAKKNEGSLKDGLDNIEEKAIILIQDIIREEAPSVLGYFEKQGVNVKVISGDNPVTVSAVAKRAGVHAAERYVDARTLPDSVDELKEVVDSYTVFGRVTPHQKKNIVKALQANKHTVAMTGDGVNDVLALKESDCGIAMANGSDATKAVAQLVLMNSDFSSLPKVVEEGRKQINNLERVSELFLSKTVFFVIIAFVFCIMMLPYPILPIQSSLVGGLAIGLPSVVLAMLPYDGKVRKEDFLTTILKKSLPNGIATVIFTTIAFVIAYNSNNGLDYARTVALLVYAGISFVILLKVALPINKLKAVTVVGSMAIFALAYFIALPRKVFSLKWLDIRTLAICVILIVASVPCIIILKKIIGIVIDKKVKRRLLKMQQ
ncbi:HAD-IC family P-type ATPase [Clostridium sp. HCP1S3_B4]|uniref:HAD-IC family P-type ATPase n=1 Tax=unclassified Clostridium TaxID=2614128 RepID=UPI002A778A36|nr:HAD-IC family P-type ATPase [Clostridium sp.]